MNELNKPTPMMNEIRLVDPYSAGPAEVVVKTTDKGYEFVKPDGKADFEMPVSLKPRNVLPRTVFRSANLEENK